MNLKNIVLKTTELGCSKWEDVEKLILGENDYICIISSEEITKTDENGQYVQLVGKYFNTGFKHKPSYKELINMIISAEYPNGKEKQLLRIGIKDPKNQEFLDYYDNVENIKLTIKNLLIN